MNGFQKFNISHTSASQINLFANAPDVWIAEKLFGLRGGMGEAAQRGISVEKAIVGALMNGETHEEAAEKALKDFDKKTAVSNSVRINKERAAIAGFVRSGIDGLREFGQPHFENNGEQNKIEVFCNGAGYRISIIGYLDLVYPRHNAIIDIKTTFKKPTKMSKEHSRQAAIYKKATGVGSVKFLYLTPDEFVFHECNDEEETLKEIKQILNGQEEFLRGGTREELALKVEKNFSSMYWNGNEHNIEKVYGTNRSQSGTDIKAESSTLKAY